MFTPSGNAVSLGAGGITQTSGTTLNDFIPFTLTASQTWTVATPGQLILNGPATLALGANNLTISGDGSPSFSGNTVTGSGTITLLGTTSQTLTVTGNLNSTGAINVGNFATLNLSTPAAIATPIVVNTRGTLTDAIGFSGFMNAPLTINVGGTYAVIINGTAVLQFSRATVNTAPITLAGNLVVTNNTPAVAGTVYTIILNQTGSPIVGTFAGLPEGATFTAGGQTFLHRPPQHHRPIRRQHVHRRQHVLRRCATGADQHRHPRARSAVARGARSTAGRNRSHSHAAVTRAVNARRRNPVTSGNATTPSVRVLPFPGFHRCGCGDPKPNPASHFV
ncbi:MAG TPA: hypothetical protein VGR95_12630 [Thermoanaerobaculia bacterium]|jgi:hypothetical protein|nr:hypothetical protein [Thermoanaerobaculia bacterium]